MSGEGATVADFGFASELRRLKALGREVDGDPLTSAVFTILDLRAQVVSLQETNEHLQELLRSCVLQSPTEFPKPLLVAICRACGVPVPGGIIVESGAEPDGVSA